MTRLRARLDACRRAGRAAVVGYLPAGFPDRETHQALIARAFTAGLDALEIGLPGPPPPTEGSTIVSALTVGGQAVDGVRDSLALAAAARVREEDVLIALAYDAVLEAAGIDALLETCRGAEVDAVLVPQQSMQRQLNIARIAQGADIDVVIFLHRRGDIRQLVETDLVDPIIYLQSASQHTGAPFDQDTAVRRLRDLRSELGSRPARVLVGFGVASPRDVEVLVRAGADGVVVGTAVVDAAAAGIDELDNLVVALRSAASPAASRRQDPERE